ncbi:bifunctional phosphoribosylaminoimidazolecarboxamide formyltransferase/IMP cyclohydrolase [Bdellovibrio sp. NC01]|uniref:bifunctional phosphoribosylaminoimidazolecarboxamide formyltransferase/IMP cyclohydrolase n=1 Tax=Bdellovibrio sp. NC01 TaxID=2220073 RepID=UPI00115BEB64|nr:bifunctional phosphoribosylaminoimidazolecarboxamide formyltransferase/IMP cyclohydrolase [Bdellovibrio sp. NC01]QDK38832.1 bifunctional phosphoribosylaminoimidazolecarboxamide formyltransferase/IMP cyclohydrolase PurH [Bdellovibrio sp. NC01]
MTIKRALLSVSDKTGLIELAHALTKHHVELIASGGTAKSLEQAGFTVTPVEKVSGNPEAFQGRMKTLSFEISSALLFRRDDSNDLQTAKDLNIEAIDLVVVNLYPFHETLKKQAPFAECVENIDIGGPTMLRAAAKNHAAVTVLSSPEQYGAFMKEFNENNGATTLPFRQMCAAKVFTMTAFYDMAIAGYLTQASGKQLRYGENPHQSAVLLQDPFTEGLAHKESLQGKEMSYNNFLDADFAAQALKDMWAWQGDYTHPSVVVVKHNTPCGMAIAETPLRALQMAWKGDEKSSFGGVLALSFPVTEEIAVFFQDKFVEVIQAPGFSPAAQMMLKKNCRLVELDLKKENAWQIRSLEGGALLQQKDTFSTADFKTVTHTSFPQEKQKLAAFAFLCVKNLKSNAIAVCAQNGSEFEMVTLGSGQTNRVDCIEKLVIPRLQDKGIKDASQMVLASDAFFPFADSIEIAAKVGVKYIVQPGGSIKDQEVIAEADKQGIAMMFTGRRHFLH